MMSTTHGLVGCLIAQRVPNPTFSYPLILGSHVLMDVIPHWDFGTEWSTRSKMATGLLALVDIAAAFVLGIILFSQTLGIAGVVIAVSLANLPDWMEVPWFIFFAKQGEKSVTHGGMVRKISYWIYKVQELYFHTRDTFPHGVFTQIGFVLFLYFLLK